MNRRLHSKERISAYLFILPAVLGVLIFYFYPLLISLFASFRMWSGLEGVFEAPFNGVTNYVSVLKDPYFGQAVVNTLFTMIGIPIGITLSLLLAMLLNRGLKGTNAFRVIYYVPVVCGIVGVTLMWQNFLAPNGPFNKFLAFFGYEGMDWLAHRVWAKVAIVVMCVWKGLGYSTLLYIAGLQGIPRSYYEAAKLDGASGFRLFFHITVPLIKPVTFFLFVTGIISGAQLFTEAQLILPAASRNQNFVKTVVLYLYEQFGWGYVGYASAVAWLLALVVFAVTGLQFAIEGRKKD
ncbi:sugar ABC transporter permease [Clostridia bacterium]|nr:sugar ABC transporter permease [Clostridia bacterium]